MVKVVDEGLEFGRDEEQALWFEGAPDAGNGGGELFLKQGVGFGIGDVIVEGTFQDVGEHQAEFLEFGEYGFVRLPFRTEWNGLENGASFAFEGRLRRIKKIGIEFGSDRTEDERLDVNRAEARGPSEALEATRDVGGVGELAAAVARQKDGIGHG